MESDIDKLRAIYRRATGMDYAVAKKREHLYYAFICKWDFYSYPDSCCGPENVLAMRKIYGRNPTFDEWLSSINLTRYGMEVNRFGPYEVRFSYTHVPDIHVNMRIDSPTYIKMLYYPDIEQPPQHRLIEKMILKYGTPYPEEVVALRLIARLPQPIAEAISDCICAVMERRFILLSCPELPYVSRRAKYYEIECTAKENGCVPIASYSEMKNTPNLHEWERFIMEDESDDSIQGCRLFSGDDGW